MYDGIPARAFIPLTDEDYTSLVVSAFIRLCDVDTDVLVGEVMQASRGKADPVRLREVITQLRASA